VGLAQRYTPGSTVEKRWGTWMSAGPAFLPDMIAGVVDRSIRPFPLVTVAMKTRSDYLRYDQLMPEMNRPASRCVRPM
jgi:hypothetical protein